MSSTTNVTQPNTIGAVRMGECRQPVDRRKKLSGDKANAKIGMTLSMGALVATGMMRGSGAKTIHIVSGIALVGFSFWHHHLYQPASGRSDG